MKQTIFTGAACALVTPFDENGKVDYNAFKKLIDFQIDNGTDAIVVCGTTGEVPTLSNREQKQIIKSAAKHINGRVPLIAGAGSNCTETALKRCLEAQNAGADALLVVTPYYNKCSPEGLTAHYSRIGNNVSLPIIVYNVPSRTGMNIAPETYVKLSKINNITAVKEAGTDIASLIKTRALCGDSLDIYSGNDELTAPFMAVGAKGVISVLSNIMPRQMHELTAEALSGNYKKSNELQMKYADICETMFCAVNPVPVKFALQRLGYCNGRLRLPLTSATSAEKARITIAMTKCGLIK